MSGTQCAATENLAPSMGAMNPTAVAYKFQGDGYGRMDGGTPQGSNDLPSGAMRGVRSTGSGSSSQERGLEGSQPGEFAAPVPELPHEGAQVGGDMHAVRQAAQGFGVLRDALPAVQEVGRPGETWQLAIEAVQPAKLHSAKSQSGDVRQALAAGQAWDAGTSSAYQERSGFAAMAVRRLTPGECESLQGFPDGYTAVPNRGKPAADGPRYKALGNSWAVPNVRWIGRRIDLVAALLAEKQMEAA
jgi:DNA (cytosine-5)-methyltransferase 1